MPFPDAALIEAHLELDVSGWYVEAVASLDEVAYVPPFDRLFRLPDGSRWGWVSPLAREWLLSVSDDADGVGYTADVRRTVDALLEVSRAHEGRCPARRGHLPAFVSLPPTTLRCAHCGTTGPTGWPNG
jgi:hypothetical protein